jgi:hypothetical protein
VPPGSSATEIRCVPFSAFSTPNRSALSPDSPADRQRFAALMAYNDLTPDAFSSVNEVVSALRKVGNPYELAYGLIRHTEVLLRFGDNRAGDTLSEARGIAQRLDSLSLLARAGSLTESAGARSFLREGHPIFRGSQRPIQ